MLISAPVDMARVGALANVGMQSVANGKDT